MEIGINVAVPRRKRDLRAELRVQCTLFLLSLLLLMLIRDAAAVPNLRGVASQDEKYFQTAIIKCKDGSKTFPQERLNDDFCDCVDGTDEPGTNACPNGKFYCKNLGHRAIQLFSSRVNDGICDCCDGSDEYDGKVKCPNTCRESGKQSTEKLKKKFSTFKEGVAIRNRDVEDARKQLERHEIELGQLRKEHKIFKDVVAKLKVDKEAVEKQEQEEKEKERREKELQEKREKEDSREKEMAEEKDIPQHAEGAQTQVDVHQESPQETDAVATDAKIEGLNHLTEAERGRVVASRWTGEDVSDILSKEAVSYHGIAVEDDLSKEAVPDHDIDVGEDLPKEAVPVHDMDVEDDMSKGAVPDRDIDVEDDLSKEAAPEQDINMEDDEEEDLPPENDEDEDVAPENDEDDECDVSLPSLTESYSQELADSEHTSWWSRLFILPEYFSRRFRLHKPPVDKSEAERIRKEYQEANDKLQDLERKIDDLEKRTQQDFGKEGEFYGFFDNCFELKDKKYTYRVCPYKDATQTESHSSTRLGRWQGFKEDYKQMIFELGDKCWNGPERSLRVKMRCGSKLELRSIDEPSRCEYAGEFSTPALCTPSKVQALEQQLLQNDHESFPPHDEL